MVSAQRVAADGTFREEGGPLEQVLKRLADAFCDLAGAFGSADGHFFTCACSATTDGRAGVDGMQGDEVASPFGGTFGETACTFRSAGADVPCAASDFFSGSAVLLLFLFVYGGLRGGSGLVLRGLRGRKHGDE